MTKPRTSASKMTPVKSASGKGAAGSARRPRTAKASKPRKASAKPETIREAIGPIDERYRRLLIVRAMEDLRNGGRRGNKTQVWSLGDGVLFEAGIRLVSGEESVEAIVVSLDSDLKAAKVTARSMRRFLDNLRGRYRDLVYSHTKHMATDSVIDTLGGDIGALSTLIVTKLGAEVMKSIESAEFGTLDNKDKHALIRASEMFVEAARIQADTRLKDAQISMIADRIMAAQIKRSSAVTSGKGKSTRAALTRDEIIGAVRAAVLGEDGGQGVAA